MIRTEPATNQQENTQLPRSHSASALQLSILSPQGQLMFLSSHFLLLFQNWSQRLCTKSEWQICHVSAEPCRSATLGISVVTLYLRLHDTRSQNTTTAGTSPPSVEKWLLLQAGRTDSSVWIKIFKNYENSRTLHYYQQSLFANLSFHL